jgi:hypothetical protein
MSRKGMTKAYFDRSNSEASAQNHKTSHGLLYDVQSGIRQLAADQSDFSTNLNAVIGQTLSSHSDPFVAGIHQRLSSTIAEVDQRMQHSSRKVAEAVTITMTSSHDGQRDLIQTGFHSTQRRLDKLEARVDTALSQQQKGGIQINLSGQHVAISFIVLYCFSEHRYAAHAHP